MLGDGCRGHWSLELPPEAVLIASLNIEWVVKVITEWCHAANIPGSGLATDYAHRVTSLR